MPDENASVGPNPAQRDRRIIADNCARIFAMPDPDDQSSSRKLPPEAPIHLAARMGDITELDRLIAAGANVDGRADIDIGSHGPCTT